jgi:hypothetical protein
LRVFLINLVSSSFLAAIYFLCMLLVLLAESFPVLSSLAGESDLVFTLDFLARFLLRSSDLPPPRIFAPLLVFDLAACDFGRRASVLVFLAREICFPVGHHAASLRLSWCCPPGRFSSVAARAAVSCSLRRVRCQVLGSAVARGGSGRRTFGFVRETRSWRRQARKAVPSCQFRFYR